MAKKRATTKPTGKAAAELAAVRAESATLRRLADAQERQRALLRRLRRGASPLSIARVNTARELVADDEAYGVYLRAYVDGLERERDELQATVTALIGGSERPRDAREPAAV